MASRFDYRLFYQLQDTDGVSHQVYWDDNEATDREISNEP